MLQYFKDLNMLFNPDVNYDGDFSIIGDTLYSVQKGEMYEKFLDKHFGRNSEIGKCFGDLYFDSSLENIIFNSELGSNSYGRVLKINGYYYIYSYLKSYFGNLLGDSTLNYISVKSLDEYTQQVIRGLREKMSELRGIRQTGNYEFSGALKNLYEAYLVEYEDYTEEMFLNIISQLMVDFITALRKVDYYINKPINIDEFGECFDIQKLYLAVAKQILEFVKMDLRNGSEVLNNSISVAINYAIAVKQIRQKNPGYNFSITAYVAGEDDFVEERKKYSIDDFLKELDDLLVAHPEFKFIDVKPENGEDLRDLAKATEKRNQLKKELEAAALLEEISSCWQILPKGERQSSVSKKMGVIDRQLEVNKNREERLAEIQKRESFFETTGYMYKILGRDSFNGYVGYIYETGVVVYEKFYENVETGAPAKCNATYVMNIYNFADLCRQTKGEIRSAKKTGVDVIIRNHTSGWEERISKDIMGLKYSDSKLETIEYLMNVFEKSQKSSLER